MARNRGNLFLALGCCCLLAAGGLLGYNLWDEARAEKQSAALTEEVSGLLRDAALPDADYGEDPALSQPAESGAEESVPSLSVDGCDVMGVLEIPALELRLPVLSEWSYPNLKLAPCRYCGTPDTQLVLLAHNYAKHFRDIGRLQPGDTVTLQTGDGSVYTYAVTATETYDGSDLAGILSGEWDLTLFTCNYTGEKRIVVRCDLL